MFNKEKKFILAIFLQIIIILIIIVFKMSILTGGKGILLKVSPVDPRDVLRGDFVDFQYSISNIDYYYNNYSNRKVSVGDTVYVELREGFNDWYFSYAYNEKPKNNNRLFIKGVVKKVEDVSESNNFGYQKIYVVYGIEQYFIPEGKGQGFSFNNKDVYANVSVDGDGRAVLKGIYIDQKRWP
jgi:uncharacterized membrane-anchored protein